MPLHVASEPGGQIQPCGLALLPAARTAFNKFSSLALSLMRPIISISPFRAAIDGPTYSPESRTAARTALIRTLA